MSEIYGKDETEFSGKLLCTTPKSSVYRRLGLCQKINHSVKSVIFNNPWQKRSKVSWTIRTSLDSRLIRRILKYILLLIVTRFSLKKIQTPVKYFYTFQTTQIEFLTSTKKFSVSHSVTQFAGNLHTSETRSNSLFLRRDFSEETWR